jgi:hypothetical protein
MDTGRTKENYPSFRYITAVSTVLGDENYEEIAAEEEYERESIICS